MYGQALQAGNIKNEEANGRGSNQRKRIIYFPGYLIFHPLIFQQTKTIIQADFHSSHHSTHSFILSQFK
jgi:hypothetical protein